jgi:tetratricopeptide (TPR) repeat protein
MGLGRNADAIRAYQQAIRISPRYAGALNNLGVRYARLGQWEEAAESTSGYSNQAGQRRGL